MCYKINNLLKLINFGDGIDVTGMRVLDGLVGFQAFLIVNIFAWRYKNKPIKMRYSQIDMTATQIRSEVADTKQGLESSITQTATEIRTEVNNTASGLNSKIDQTANSITSQITDTKNGLETEIKQTQDSITSTVNNKVSNLQSQITQQADLIDQKMSRGTDFASEIKQQADAVTIAIKNKTDTNIVFDSNGETIKNGALRIEDNNGNIIMQFKDGVAVVKDLDMNNGNACEKGSAFYNTLANMKEVSLPLLKVSDQFVCRGNDIYISDFGGSLEEYIEHVVKNM